MNNGTNPNMIGRFVQVDPDVPAIQPDDPAILHPTLETAGFTHEVERDYWRCCECNKMQPVASTIYWIDDSIRIGDSWDSIVWRRRKYSWNGAASGWCQNCATKLLPPQAQPQPRTATRARHNTFRRFLRLLLGK